MLSSKSMLDAKTRRGRRFAWPDAFSQTDPRACVQSRVKNMAGGDVDELEKKLDISDGRTLSQGPVCAERAVREVRLNATLTKRAAVAVFRTIHPGCCCVFGMGWERGEGVKGRAFFSVTTKPPPLSTNTPSPTPLVRSSFLSLLSCTFCPPSSDPAYRLPRLVAVGPYFRT